MSKENVSVFKAHKRARLLVRKKGIAFPIFSLLLVLFFAFCGVASVISGILFAVSAHTALGNGVAYAIAALLSLLLFWLLFSPLGQGARAFALGCVFYERIDYSTIFSFYTSKKRYMYALRVSLSSAFRILTFFALLFAVMRIGRSLAEELILGGDNARAVLLLSLTVLFSLLTLLMLWVFSVNRYAMDAALLSAPLLSYRQIKAVSRCAVRGHLGAILRHQIIFSFYILLSIPCLGVPLLFVLPYKLMARGTLSAAFLEK